ncbi:hypothetical protein O3M35_000877 [Rhynocoris fuscipes]|uniref:Uncharacterized protein n=1 Tax=Rhynocoris fuscipes TaxID=488301 RepID=A0AAW1DTG2_9HEMI
MIIVVLASLLASVWCQKGHYVRHSIDYYPLPLARRMPLYQELSLVEPRVYAPLVYKSAAQSRDEPASVEETNKEQSSSSSQDTTVNLDPDKDIDVVPILSYSNDMAPNGGYSYRYETSDGMTREESAIIEDVGEDEDGSARRTVRGSYSYPSPDGRIINVEYVADRDGFRTRGHHLPSTKLRSQYLMVH